ncbi:MAG TPA: hypothetical protein PLP64_06540 [Pseudothermotoga sp.]|nr:hypothetical protein [Pseudothermotoga sp.]
MKVGLFETNLSFPTGLSMAGYVQRNGISTGYHDPLKIFCIYLCEDEKEVAILVFDLLTIPENFPRKIENTELIPVATHTHSGPKPDLVRDILESYAEKALLGAKQSASDLIKVTVRRFAVSDVCDFRDKPESSAIPARLIEFETVERLFSILLFPCHPTVLGPENLLYSSDLIGSIREKLRTTLNHPVVFLNSCCGNISTHRTRRDRSFSEVERLSDLFLDQFSPVTVCQILKPEGLLIVEREFEVRFVQKNINELMLDERDLPGALLLKKRINSPKNSRVRISFLKMNSLKFVFVPFELFFEFLRLIPLDAPVFVVCYANSPASYVVPKSVKSGYEWLASPYSDDTEMNLLALVSDELKKL